MPTDSHPRTGLAPWVYVAAAGAVVALGVLLSVAVVLAQRNQVKADMERATAIEAEQKATTARTGGAPRAQQTAEWGNAPPNEVPLPAGADTPKTGTVPAGLK